eukprot:23474-Eustigmatos_ZCMA.PRE.1
MTSTRRGRGREHWTTGHMGTQRTLSVRLHHCACRPSSRGTNERIKDYPCGNLYCGESFVLR